MSNQEIVDYLQQCGVCLTCVLRYFKARGNEYENKRQTFRQLRAEYKVDKTDDNVNKLRRLSPCSTCLGLFSTEFQEQLIEKISSSGIDGYDAEGIVVAISMPILLQIRQLSMWYALIRKFRNFVPNRVPDVPLKEAIKLVVSPIICKKLNKKYDTNGLKIHINLVHSQEDAEMAQLLKLHEVAFPRQLPDVSRGVFEKQYDPTQVDDKLFEEYLPIPPDVPTEILKLDSITLQGPTVCVAGRYKKLTRELSHTPWVLHGKRIMEDSIEEILIRSIGPHFCKDTSKIIFMSSGREDVDVRCLGKGRPFVLEIAGAYRSKLPKETAAVMEKDIELSQKIAIQDLQIVHRDELVHIKTGEEKKRKYYRALCALKEPVTVEILEKLNLPDGFEIQQKTPIRVLHRRPLITRPRMIYSMKAAVQRHQPNVVVLDMVSQAGTYIKELVHGEFGRTQPSVASLIGKPIDILALDVTGIDLEWPPEVKNTE